jgi:hypothetical protein
MLVTPLNPGRGLFASAHQMGTCRMSKSPKLGVVDPNCQVNPILQGRVVGAVRGLGVRSLWPDEWGKVAINGMDLDQRP